MATHDAAAFVRRAVESVQNQTLRNVELVVVDAGSTDDTVRTLESIAERDLRVHVTQAGECGRLEALDLALERACGTYVAVMDQDAWAEPSYLSELVELADERSLELVVGGLSLELSVDGGRPSELSADVEGIVFPTQHDFRSAAWQLLAAGELLPAAGKLFARERVERVGARFAGGGAHGFVISYLRDVERVGVVSGARYHVARPSRHLAADAALKRYRFLEAEHEALLELLRHWGLDGDAASVEALQSRYVELLTALIEAVCGWTSTLASADQRRAVSQMIEGNHAQLAASVAHPRDPGARALVTPIRTHNAALACVQSRLVALLRWGRLGVGVDAYL